MSPTEMNFLLATPYFRSCTMAEISIFRTHLQVVQYDTGENVFQQGLIEGNWYLVRQGNIRIERCTHTGVRHTLAEIGAGEAFGEMGLLERSPRMATALANEPTVLLVLESSVFQQLLDDRNPVAMSMLRAMAITQSRRLREMTLTMQDLTELDSMGDYAPTPSPLGLSTLLKSSYLLT
jgi:CRP/FNR family cyclic AMP-dependent transcriptional regulator